MKCVFRRAAVSATAVVAIAMPLLAMAAEPVSVLFVGNSYTFGRVDPAMSYNAANVRDLTVPMWLANPTGSNAFEPHPWGGVAGIFKQFTVQAGLDYDVAFSSRNAASLRGHMLNSNPDGWDMRSNIARRPGARSCCRSRATNRWRGAPAWDRTRSTSATTPTRSRTLCIPLLRPPRLRDRDAFPGATSTQRQAACVAAGISAGTCSIDRGSFTNSYGSAATEMYLYETWARPNLVDGAFVTHHRRHDRRRDPHRQPRDDLFSRPGVA